MSTIASRWTAKFHFPLELALNQRPDHIRLKLYPQQLQKARCSDCIRPHAGQFPDECIDLWALSYSSESSEMVSGITLGAQGRPIGSETEAIADDVPAKMAR